MELDWKKIGMWVLGASAVGGTAWFGYKMYKAYKDIYGNMEEQDKEMAEQPVEISEEVAAELQAQMNRLEIRDQIAPLQKYWGYDLTALSEEAAQHIVWVSRSEEEEDPEYFAKVIEFNDKVVRDDIITAQEEADLIELEKLTIKDVEFEMIKYDVNSDQALEQFNEMMLSDFDRGSDEWFILRSLLDEPVLSDIPQDRITASNIIERRSEFFGPNSKWSNEWTWGEVIIYFGARAASDLPSESYMDYVENWVLDMGIDIEYMESVVSDLNNTEFWYNGIFGIFSLDDEDVEEHCRNYGFANRHVLPLETQYQIWLSKKLGL